jgi:hypothetical protein
MAEDSENEAELSEVPASEILEKIEKGELVEYDHVRIVGDMDVSKLNLPTENVARTEFQINVRNLSTECRIVASPIKISHSEFKDSVDFSNCLFKARTEFWYVAFSGNNGLMGAVFNESALFTDVTFRLFADFLGATFDGYASFSDATFCEGACFDDVKFSGDTSFIGAKWLSGDASFIGAKFSGDACFGSAKFGGDNLTFRDAEFHKPSSQEDACRRAKIILEKNGDREEAGYHFYKEMDGKRRQKPWYIRYPEYIFVQLVFGYGVHPFRLMAWWFGFVFLFAVAYSLGHGIDAPASQLHGNATLADYIWFSIATAVTPGYAGYKPTPDFKLVAGLEAIFGTFMWAAFIATFARKYMR